MANLLHVSHVDAVAIMTLNRPEKRNALNGELIRELSIALHQAADDERVRVVLLNGQGEHFCAGADIAWMQQVASGSFNENYDDAQLLADLLYQLYSFPKPTLVLAHGATLGGGLGLLAASDIALASEQASFGFSEVKIGITPSTISPYVITAIGERAAHYYFLTGERFNAETAQRIGLVHQLVKPELLLETGIELAQRLLQNSPHALMVAKQLIRHVAKERITPELAQKTAEHLANLRTTEEAREGLRAFLEKRSPNWVSSS